MARETKVGLLAGLAFIICFAIILANRGRQDIVPSNPPYADRVDQNVVAQGPASQTLPVTIYQSPATNVPNDRGASAALPGTLDRSRPVRVDRSRAIPQRHLPTESAVAAEQPSPDTTPGRGPAAPVRAGGQDTENTVAAAEEADRLKLLEQRLDELSKGLHRERRLQSLPEPQERIPPTEPTAIDPTAPRTATELPTAIVTRHTVMPGDTLSKIAGEYYGSKSRRLIEAIFDANRTILANPDMLGVGMELVIPMVSGVDGATRSANDPRRRVNTKPAADEPRTPKAEPARRYQIKKNDRYVSIAREQLGDVSRWREIYELNKEIFPDPEFIREGVRIKLPAVEVADARGGRGR